MSEGPLPSCAVLVQLRGGAVGSGGGGLMTGPLNFFNYRLIFVDCEGANLEPWGDWPLREFGAVDYATRISFYGEDNSRQTFERFLAWLEEFDTERMVFISDNPAYDWPPIKWYFMKHDLENPFGH